MKKVMIIVIVLILFGIIGAVIYFSMGKKDGSATPTTTPTKSITTPATTTPTTPVTTPSTSTPSTSTPATTTPTSTPATTTPTSTPVSKVDCSGSWSGWSECDKLCGGGVSRRAFTVITPANATGQACPASPQTQACNTQACPVPINCVGSWSEWSACDKTCGGGTQNRTYTVTTAAQNGGTQCLVANGTRETQACNTQACAVSGRTTSCYGTGDAYCKSCVDVVNSYKRKNWAYDITNFEQCKINESNNKTCYGANNNICNNCVDVVNAYKARYWAYDINNFDQCKI